MNRSESLGKTLRVFGMLLILLGAMAVAALGLTFFAGSTSELSSDPNNPAAARAESLMRAGRSGAEVVLGFGGFASIVAGFTMLRRGRQHLVELAQDSELDK